MAKKPMRISEILGKRSTGGTPPVGADDFIAETQNLINQYSRESLAEELKIAPLQSAPLETQKVEISPETSETIINTPSDAPESSPAPDLVTPSSTMDKIKADDSRSSILKRNNSVTIAEQLRNVSVTESVTSSVTTPKQFRNSYGTITEQLRNDSVTNSNNTVTKAEQLRNDSVTESVTHSVTITEQLRNDSVTTPVTPPHVNRLAGNKLSIVQTIFEYCQERGSTNSGPVSRESFEGKTGIEGEVIRVTCTRLVKEGYLKVLESKRGNGGFTVYELHPITHSQLVSGYIRNNSVTKAERLRNNSVTESVTESVTNPPSKIDSKNNINLTTLTQNPETNWFRELDFSKVAPIGPMQVNSSIRALILERLQPSPVQEFLNRFTSWMATQTRITNPVGMFCEKLKEFANEQDSPVLYCMTEEERQIEAQFAIQVEKARSEMELIRKSREHSEMQNREEQFESWFQQASDEEKTKLFKPTPIAKIGSSSYKLGLKAVFMENGWQGE